MVSTPGLGFDEELGWGERKIGSSICRDASLDFDIDCLGEWRSYRERVCMLELCPYLGLCSP